MCCDRWADYEAVKIVRLSGDVRHEFVPGYEFRLGELGSLHNLMVRSTLCAGRGWSLC
jgi:hypothetical protein